MKRWKKKNRVKRLQNRLSLFYNSKRVQVAVATLIALNFASTATLLQMRPELNEEPYDPQVLQWLEQIDQIFTILFTLELLLNISAHWFKSFVSNGWNLFDAFIITISLVSLGPIQLPFFKAFRIMRAFRILRLFGKLQSLRLLTNALTSSLIPVANAMLVRICAFTGKNLTGDQIAVFVTSIFAGLAVNFCSEKDPENWKTFLKAMFALFQAATLGLLYC